MIGGTDGDLVALGGTDGDLGVPMGSLVASGGTDGDLGLPMGIHGVLVGAREQ